MSPTQSPAPPVPADLQEPAHPQPAGAELLRSVMEDLEVVWQEDLSGPARGRIHSAMLRIDAFLSSPAPAPAPTSMRSGAPTGKDWKLAPAPTSEEEHPRQQNALRRRYEALLADETVDGHPAIFALAAEAINEAGLLRALLRDDLTDKNAERYEYLRDDMCGKNPPCLINGNTYRDPADLDAAIDAAIDAARAKERANVE